jgi:hypothetical protein
MQRHNPEIDHRAIQPCQLIHAAMNAADAPMRISDGITDMAVNTVKVFWPDYQTRKDLCFGGMAPWEQ